MPSCCRRGSKVISVAFRETWRNDFGLKALRSSKSLPDKSIATQTDVHDYHVRQSMTEAL